MTKNDLIQCVSRVFQQQLGYSASHLTQAPICAPVMGAFFDREGKGLTCALDRRVVAVAAQREDNLIRVVQKDAPYRMDLISLDCPITPSSEYEWANQIRQSIRALKELGFPFFGADIVIGHDLPNELGLDPSVAINMAILKTLVRLYALPISDSMLGECVPNVGRLDKVIQTQHAKSQQLGWIDPRSTSSYQGVELPDSHCVMLMTPNRMTDNKVLHPFIAREGAQWLGVKSFRDLTLNQFELYRHRVDTVTAEQVKYAIQESDWTDSVARAIEQENWLSLGNTMLEAHQHFCQAMQAEFSDCDVLTHLVLNAIQSIGGVRAIQWGHQQAVVAILPKHKVNTVKAIIHERFELKTGVSVSTALSDSSSISGALSLREMAMA